MIYFLIDPVDGDNRVKIGFSKTPDGVVKRFMDHRGSNTRLEFYCAIEGDSIHEKMLHEHFASSRVIVDGNKETFRLSPELKDYLEWLGEQTWAACTLEEVIDPFAHFSVDVMWPNQPYRQSSSQPITSLFTPDIGELRAPLSPQERLSYAVRDSNEWYTPPQYIEAARRTMGSIDLDPSSSPFANKNVRAARYYTKRDDGLAPSNLWRGNVFMNPPYGGMQEAFIKRLLHEFDVKNVTQAVVCLNGYRYDTRWFQPLWAFPMCFCSRRVRFLGGASTSGPKTAEDNNPANGTVFVYMGENFSRFVDEFTEFGNVIPFAYQARRTA